MVVVWAMGSLNDLGDDARADGLAALADGEALLPARN
jgi:hypothetical protein